MAYDPTIPTLENYIGDDIPAIAANFAELAGSRIVEMGSNSNGTYVRWENGLQVCFATRSTSASEDTLWTLPAAFIDTGWTPCGGVAAAFEAGAQVITFQGRTTSSIMLRVLNASGNRVPGSAFIIAIGRWK